MEWKKHLLSAAIGLVIGGGAMYLTLSNGKYDQPNSQNNRIDSPSDQEDLISKELQDFLAKNTVGKTEAIRWIKIFKFRSQDLSNPPRRNENDPERRGGFSGNIAPSRYFTIPIDYIRDAFNQWNREAGFPTRLNVNRANEGFYGFRIYPMIYPNEDAFGNKRSMNLLLVPIKSDLTELTDYKNKSGVNQSTIFKLPLQVPGTIYNEIGQCPPSCTPVGTLDSLSGN